MPTESFFSDSSLAYISSVAAGKEGKAYSMRPTDGTADFDFSRGSNITATRVGPDGLIEKGRENLMIHSNSLDTTWNAGGTLTGGQAGYDGNNDAWLFEKTSDFQAMAQTISHSNILTFSIYAKAGDTEWIRIRCSNSETRYFQLTGSGAVGVYNPSNIIAEIELVSGTTDWYRCSMTVINGLTDVKIYPAQADNTMGTTGSVYLQDSQLEVGTVMTAYIETTAAPASAGLLENEPRYDYFNELSVLNPLTEPYLLLEDGSTNLVRYSEYLKGLSITTANLTQNATISPDGTKNACLIETTASAARVSSINHSFTANDVITVSCYVKNIDATQVRFYYFDVTNVYAEDIGEFTSEISTEEWRRVTATYTIPQTTTNAQIQFCRITASGQSLYAYGFQIEKQSFASSYIPNHGLSAGAERLDELSRVDTGYDKNSDWTFFMEFETNLKKVGASDSKIYFQLGNEQRYMGRVTNYYFNANDIRNWWRMYDVNRYLTSDSNSIAKWCFIKQGLNIKVYTQGVLAYDITQELNDNQYLIFELLHGKYKKILVYDTPISEEDAIELTTL